MIWRLKKLYPIGLDPEPGSLHFQANQKRTIKGRLGQSLAGQHSAKTPTKQSVGLEGKMPLPKWPKFHSQNLQPGVFFFRCTLFLVAAGPFVQAARTKSILRGFRDAETAGRKIQTL